MAIITKKRGSLEYLTAQQIPVPHGFTTRLGGVSRGYLSSLNIGLRRGDTPENVAENYGILAEALGFDVKKLALTRQTHSDIIRRIGPDAPLGSLRYEDWEECDGLITDVPGVTLTVFTADCTPILLYDPVTGAVGAVHAGWRGTAANIAGKAVAAMAEAYGSRPENLRAAIGPNIGPCCFETDRDVPEAMEKTYGEAAKEWIRPVNEKYYVNLKAMNALSLRNAGVEQIEISTDCTACQSSRFWSHRITGGERGSQGAVIVCRGEKL